jgi:hypothetical protein
MSKEPSLEALASEINARFQKAGDYYGKVAKLQNTANDHRIAAGLRLIEPERSSSGKATSHGRLGAETTESGRAKTLRR